MTAWNWKARAALRRDTRHTASTSEVPPHRGHRDTKRWCKGKLGQEHTLAVSTYAALGKWQLTTRSPIVRYCTRCGREFEIFFRFGPEAKAPDWAKAYLANHPEARHAPKS